LGYNISYEGEKDFNIKAANFVKVLGIINQIFKPSLVSRHTRIRIYKKLARPVLSYGKKKKLCQWNWDKKQKLRLIITLHFYNSLSLNLYYHVRWIKKLQKHEKLRENIKRYLQIPAVFLNSVMPIYRSVMFLFLLFHSTSLIFSSMYPLLSVPEICTSFLPYITQVVFIY
jgi:hypothetical protein